MKGLKPKLAILLSNIWPIFGILLISLVFFYPVWFKNKIPLPVDALVGAHVPWTELKWEEYPSGIPIKNLEISDAFSQFYLWKSFVGQFWRQGEIPLWNQFMFLGTPFLATWHSAALYPLNFLYLFLSDINAWTALLFLQILCSGIFMFLFLRELQLTKAACLFGSIGFMFCGYMVAWLEFATGGQAGLWLPLLLFFQLKLHKTQRGVWIAPIDLTFLFIFTGGDFLVPFYITSFYILLTLYWFLVGRKDINFLIKSFSGLFLGIFLSAPQLLPSIELFSQSVRRSDPYINEYFYGLMHWEKIVNFLWPDFFGNVVTRNYWGRLGYHEYLAFVGVTGLVFATASFFSKKDLLEKFFWLILFLSFAFLFPTPLAFVPYELKIPGLGTSFASRIIFLSDFLLATLAAYGFHKWQKQKFKLSKVLMFYMSASIGVVLGIVVSIYIMQKEETSNILPIVSNLKVSLKNIIPSSLVLLTLTVLHFVNVKLKKSKNKSYSCLIVYLILILSTTELLRFAWKNNPFMPRKFVFPQTEITKFLQNQETPFRIAGGIPLNLFMYFKLESVEGYDPIYPILTSEWYSLVNAKNFNALGGRYGLVHNFSSQLLDFANLKYVVDYKKNHLGQIDPAGSTAPGIDEPRYVEVFSEGRIKVFENKNALPRIWLSTNYSVIKDRNEAVDILLKSESSERLVILEKEPGLTFKQDSDLNYKLSSYKFDLNETSFSVESSRDALVFLSESFYPGWRAYVDNQEVEIFRANFLFQSIPISKGVHKVKFIYKPKSFKIGLWLFSTTFVMLIGLMVYEKRYTRTRSRASSASPS